MGRIIKVGKFGSIPEKVLVEKDDTIEDALSAAKITNWRSITASKKDDGSGAVAVNPETKVTSYKVVMATTQVTGGRC